MRTRWLIAAMAPITLAACSEGLSTAQLSAAAKERIAAKLGLSADAALFTNIFVGEEIDGQRMLCGTVEGTRADGVRVIPRRFIASAEDGEWMLFVPVPDENLSVDASDDYITWQSTCKGEEAVK